MVAVWHIAHVTTRVNPCIFSIAIVAFWYDIASRIAGIVFPILVFIVFTIFAHFATIAY
jgi:hypothetical protein